MQFQWEEEEIGLEEEEMIEIPVWLERFLFLRSGILRFLVWS
jgi:hypothetical protein